MHATGSSHRWNWPIWAAAVLGIATFLSYPFVFLRWPITRDTPWVNLLMMATTLALIYVGLRRAFSSRSRLVSKIVAVPLAAIAVFGLWSFVTLVLTPHHLPASSGAPQVGQKAPDFSLPDADNRSVSLAGLLASPIDSRTPMRGVLLIFEMGHGCHACSSELHDMQRHLDDLHAVGIRPVAISNDPPAAAKAIAQQAGYTFTFLSDPAREVVNRFDVADEDPPGAVRPAEFLIDAQGIVRWRMLTTNIFRRTRAQEVLTLAELLR